MLPSTTQTLIIGAGPAGLAVAGRLQRKGLPFEILEKTKHIGWSWKNHYDRLHLHTVKQLSHLPHLPFPDEYPLYVTRQQVVDYLNQYAQHFQIQPHFETEVQSIAPSGDQWTVRTASGQQIEAEHVVIATGVNRIPHIPTWEGQEKFQGIITHSRSYKNAQPFVGSKVLVVGIGNTGAEIALDLSEHGIDTYVSVRSPVSMVPRDVFGRPVQVTAKKLAKIPFGIGDWLGTQIRKMVIGDLSKYGLPMSKVHPAVQLRETGKTPIVDIGTAAQIKAGKIKILPDIVRLTPGGASFKNGVELDFDHIILATGYKAQINDFMEDTKGLLDRFDLPKYKVGEGRFAGLYFVGFDNYKLGGILGTIYTDSEEIATKISAS